MNKSTQQFVRGVATVVRQWAEAHWRRYGAWSDMCCMCAVCAYKLQSMLQAAGVPDVVVNINSGHAFCVVQGYVVDVTATQFGYEKILFRKWDGLMGDDSAFKLGFIATTPRKLIAYQRRAAWPIEQQYRRALE